MFVLFFNSDLHSSKIKFETSSASSSPRASSDCEGVPGIKEGVLTLRIYPLCPGELYLHPVLKTQKRTLKIKNCRHYNNIFTSAHILSAINA